MTVARLQFPFVVREPELGAASLVPVLPLTLATTTRNVAVSGLLDTGATVNVLPYASGVELGFDWGRQTTSVRLGGNLRDRRGTGDRRLGGRRELLDFVDHLLVRVALLLRERRLVRELQRLPVRPRRQVRELAEAEYITRSYGRENSTRSSK
jgi:hypothetical protein